MSAQQPANDPPTLGVLAPAAAASCVQAKDLHTIITLS